MANKVLNYIELEAFFLTNILKNEPNPNLQGKPYIRLNRSQWLAFEIHSGGMQSTNIVWTVQTFIESKEPIVIFKTSKPYVQKMTRENGAFYLKSHQAKAKEKTKYTTILSNLCRYSNEHELPNDVKIAIDFQCKIGASTGLKSLVSALGNSKEFVRKIEQVLNIKFDNENMNLLMDFSRKLVLEGKNPQNALMDLINKNAESWIKKGLENRLGSEEAITLIQSQIDSQLQRSLLTWKFINSPLNEFISNDQITEEAIHFIENVFPNKFKSKSISALKISRKILVKSFEISTTISSGGSTDLLIEGSKFAAKKSAKIALNKSISEMTSINKKPISSLKAISSSFINQTEETSKEVINFQKKLKTYKPSDKFMNFI